MPVKLTDAERVEVARDNGIRIPEIAMKVAREEKVPFWAVCAFLVQETSGGRNVFGSDTTWMRGVELEAAGIGRDVTRDRYLIYKLHVGRKGFGRQGVGPMQLTAAAFQDAADRLGGCWDPESNVRVACEWIRARRDAGESWHDVALHYNGSEAYADEMDERFVFWRSLMTE